MSTSGSLRASGDPDAPDSQDRWFTSLVRIDSIKEASKAGACSLATSPWARSAEPPPRRPKCASASRSSRPETRRKLSCLEQRECDVIECASRKPKPVFKRNRKTIYLGTHPTPESAARAYNDAALSLFGPGAFQNQIGHSSHESAVNAH